MAISDPSIRALVERGLPPASTAPKRVIVVGEGMAGPAHARRTIGDTSSRLMLAVVPGEESETGHEHTSAQPEPAATSDTADRRCPA